MLLFLFVTLYACKEYVCENATPCFLLFVCLCVCFVTVFLLRHVQCAINTFLLQFSPRPEVCCLQVGARFPLKSHFCVTILLLALHPGMLYRQLLELL